MLLDNLLKTRVVQLGKLGQVVDIGNDIAEYLLQVEEILVGRRGIAGPDALATRLGSAVQAGDNVVHLLFAGLDATHNLLALDLLEVEDLVQLALQQRHKVLLVVLGPRLAVWLGVLGRRLRDVFGLEGLLQLIVGNVVPVELLDYGRAEVLAEPGRLASFGGQGGGRYLMMPVW